MATKETVATAPIVVLLYDRTFVSGSFAAAWRRHRAVYFGLAATWVLLAVLVAAAHGRGGSVGLDRGADWGDYALTQGWAVLHYLRLVVWPAPLVFDYGTGVMSPAAALPYAAAALGLLVIAAFALRRWPVAGFLGCAFFAILAPSSGLVPIVTEVAAEHRMYLALAAVSVGWVLILDWLVGWGRSSALGTTRSTSGVRIALALCLALAGALSVATARRNEDYRDPIRLWQSAADAVPSNPRAQANLAEALAEAGRYPEAAARCREALRIAPRDAQVWLNLGDYEAAAGEGAQAIAAYETSLGIEPNSADAQVNLGVLLARAGRGDDALAHLRLAVRLRPGEEAAHLWLGNLLAQQGQIPAAEQEFGAAARLRPDDPLAHNNWGSALFQLGRLPEAAEQFEAALRLRPDYDSARAALARVRAQMAR